MITVDEALGIFLYPGITLAGAIFSVLGGLHFLIWFVPVGPIMAGISVLVVMRRREERKPETELLEYWRELTEGEYGQE